MSGGEEPQVRDVRLPVCEPCLAREGEECRTPGCVFFLCSVSELPASLADYARAAAPAETEAGDDGAVARYALATLIDEIGAEVGVAPGQPALVLTQVRGWMENARRTNVENERLRAASRPAQGPAETESPFDAREEVRRARERMATVPPHARPMWTPGSFGDRARLAATPPAPEGEAEREGRRLQGLVQRWHAGEIVALELAQGVGAVAHRLADEPPAPAGSQAEGAGETAEEDDKALRVGDLVHVRWLDRAGYHHGRGHVVPTDGESFPLRVELTSPDFRGAMPSPEFVDQSEDRGEPEAQPGEGVGRLLAFPGEDETSRVAEIRRELVEQRDGLEDATGPSAAPMRRALTWAIGMVDRVAPSLQPEGLDITVRGNTIVEEDRYPAAVESAEQRERADARAEIDGPFAAVWRAVATHMACGEHPSQVASAALSAIWDSAETVSGGDLIRAERLRQITDEGWSPEHDTSHPPNALVDAATAYAMRDPAFWPFDGRPKFTGEDRERELVKAGALIAAEIDRRRALALSDPLQVGDEFDPDEAADRVPVRTTVCELTSPPRIGYRTGGAEIGWQWTGENGYRAPTARLRVVELPEGGEHR